MLLSTLLLKSENVLHAVQARRPPNQPFGRPQGAPRESDPVSGAMSDLDPLAGGRKSHRVLPHDVAGAQARETDAAGNTQPALAGPIIDRDFVQSPSASACDRLAQDQCR